MANSWDTLTLYNVYIPPQYAGFSQLDMQTGGYDGYSLRLQDESVYAPSLGSPHAAILTFMKQMPDSERRQVRTVMRLKPNPANPDGSMVLGDWEKNLSSNNVKEGFGSVTLFEGTGSPIYVWHSMYEKETSPDTYLRIEANATNDNTFGEFTDNPFKLRANSDVANEACFIWPNIFTGPSPIEGKRRIYVFTTQSGRCPHQIQSVSEEGVPSYTPSSLEEMTYVDVDADFFIDGYSLDPLNENNLDNGIHVQWSTPQQVAYFRAMEDWDPATMASDLIVGNIQPIVRATTAEAVQKNGPAVAYAGELSGGWHEGRVWGNANIGEHEFFVVYNDHFGEDDHWRVIPFNLMETARQHFEEGFAQYYTSADLTSESSYLLKRDSDPEKDRDMVRLDSWGLSHRNVIIDEQGAVQFPIVLEATFLSGGDPDDITTRSYWHWLMEQGIFMVKVDPTTGADPTISLFPIYPRPEPGLRYYDETGNDDGPVEFPLRGTASNPPMAPYSFDFNKDGWVDRQFHEIYLNADSVMVAGAIWDEVYPVNHWNNTSGNSYKFNNSFMRMTYDCDGVIVAVWIDSAKSYYGNPNPQIFAGYQEWADVPELMISASMDRGENWTLPYSINSLEHSEIFPSWVYPSFVYPADKVYKLSDNTFRLYLMVVADYSFGAFATQSTPVGLDSGCEIQYMALDFRLNPDGVGDVDITENVAPPAQMLSQNYPNPFNPSTTIRFNLPNSGNVKLSVYNIKGQLVKTLIDEFMPKNTHEIVWHGTDQNNRSVASGVYFYRLTANGRSETKKMLLMK